MCKIHLFDYLYYRSVRRGATEEPKEVLTFPFVRRTKTSLELSPAPHMLHCRYERHLLFLEIYEFNKKIHSY